MSTENQIRIQRSTDLREALIGVSAMQTGLVKLHVFSNTLSGDVYVSRGRHIVWASTPVNGGMQALLSLLSVKATGFEVSTSSGVPCGAHQLLQISLLDLVENCALVVQQIRDTLSVVHAASVHHNPAEITLQNQDANAQQILPASQLQSFETQPTEIVDLSTLNGKQLSQLLRSEVEALRAARLAAGEQSLPPGFSTPALFQPAPADGPPANASSAPNPQAQAPPTYEPTEFTKSYGKTYVRPQLPPASKEEQEEPGPDILARMNEVINTKGIDAPKSPSQQNLEPVHVEPEVDNPTPPQSDFSVDGQAYLRDKTADLFHEQKLKHLLPLTAEESNKQLLDIDTENAPDKRAVKMVKFQRLDKSIPRGALVLSGIVLIAVPMLSVGILQWSALKNGTQTADVTTAQMIADESLDDRVRHDQAQEPFRLPAGNTGPSQGSVSSEEQAAVDPGTKELIEVTDRLKRAQKLMSDGDSVEAAAIYSSALAKFPNYLWIRLSAIKAFIAIGKYAEARTICLAGMSLKLTPTEKQALERVLATIPSG